MKQPSTRLFVHFAAVVGLAFLMPFEAHSADYFMSPKGADTNAGTLNSPWKTLDRLADAQKILKSGDTVYFRGGDYVLSDSDRKSYYAWSAPGVNYKRYGTEVPTIVWDRILPRESHSWVVYVSGSGSTVDGLHWRVTERSRSYGQTPSGDIIRGNKIIPGGIVTWASGVKVRNCEITNFAIGIGAYGDHMLVEDCKISGTISHGIYVGGPDNVFRNNELDGSRGYGNMQGIQIQYAKSKRNKVYGNLLKNGMASGFVLSGQASDNQIFNNVFVNAGHQKLGKGVGWAINFWCEDGPLGPGNKVFNNTFIGTSRHGLISPGQCANKDPGGLPLGRNVAIYDNIFYPKVAVSVGLQTANVRNNIFFNVTGAVPAGNRSINPQLADPLGTTAASAKLKQGSPAIDKGLGLTPNPEDFGGEKRPTGTYDIGAFEFANSGPSPKEPLQFVVQ